jgi:hypothetical protein
VIARDRQDRQEVIYLGSGEREATTPEVVLLKATMDERGRRLWPGAEAHAIGWGGSRRKGETRHVQGGPRGCRQGSPLRWHELHS